MTDKCESVQDNELSSFSTCLDEVPPSHFMPHFVHCIWFRSEVQYPIGGKVNLILHSPLCEPLTRVLPIGTSLTARSEGCLVQEAHDQVQYWRAKLNEFVRQKDSHFGHLLFDSAELSGGTAC
jgi:hypothetical protein